MRCSILLISTLFPLKTPDGRIDFEYGLTHNISRFFHFSNVL